MVVSLEFLIGVGCIGLAGKAGRGAHFSGDRFASCKPDEALRIGKRQWTQKQCIYDAENRGIDANAKRKDENGNGCEAGGIAKGAEGVANISTGLGTVVFEALPSFHLFS